MKALFRFFSKNYNSFSISIFFLLGVAVYSNTFSASFHFDDYYYILENGVITNLGNLRSLWNFWPTRFITFLSFALNYRFNQFNVFGYHLVNFAIHLCASFLVWWLLRLTSSTPVVNKGHAFRPSSIPALFAALVFLIHPVQTEAVTYIYQRSTCLGAFFYLLSICLYVKSRILQLKGVTALHQKALYALTWIFAACAVFTKENTLTLPLTLILYEFFFLKTERRIGLMRVIPFLFLMPVVVLLLYAKNMPTSHDLHQLVNYSVTAKYYLFTQLRVFLTYLRLIFIPVGQNLDYSYPVIRAMSDLPALAGLLFLIGLLGFAGWLFPRCRLASFGIFWFILTLLPESSIVPLEDIIFEHRLYLPMAGFAFFIAGGLSVLGLDKKNKIMIAALAVLILSYSVLAYQRNKVWKNERTLWSDVVSKSPGKARGYVYLCSTCVEEGKNREAIGWCAKALQIDPLFPRIYYNLGNAYANIGKNEEAIEAYKKEININSDSPEAYNNLAAVYADTGKVEDAIALWNKAIVLNPDFVTAHFNLAQFYLKQGRYDLAVKHYNEVIKRGYKVDPEFAKILEGHGNK